jgi:hypothetical protein
VTRLILNHAGIGMGSSEVAARLNGSLSLAQSQTDNISMSSCLADSVAL